MASRVHSQAQPRQKGTPATSSDPPRWLVLVINNFCNLKCRMCDVGIGEDASAFWAHLIGSSPQNMSHELLEVILDQGLQFTPPPRIGLAYTEPLIHRDIIPFCSAIVERGLFCAITTNGFLLARHAPALVSLGVHEITVSADGPATVHDRIRGRKGSFDKLFEGVKEIRRLTAKAGHQKPMVRFSYTITDQNYTAMMPFVRVIESLEPSEVIFSHLNFITDEMADVHNSLHGGPWAMTRSNIGAIDLQHLDLDAMWAAISELKEYAKVRQHDAHIVIIPDFSSREALNTYYRQPLEFVGGRVCTDPWRMMMIRTDGTVIPAHGRCYNVPIGNVRDTSLAEIWQGARLRDFRRTLTDAGGTLPACARCCGVIGKPKGGSEHFV